MALTKVPSNLDATIATTQSQADNSTNIATTAYVDLAVSNLSDSAPAALNTLNEIAAAQAIIDAIPAPVKTQVDGV